MAITYRNTKGAPLTHTELDTNFSDLDTLKAPKESPAFTGNLSVDAIASAWGTTWSTIELADAGIGIGVSESSNTITLFANLYQDSGSNWRFVANGQATAVNFAPLDTVFYRTNSGVAGGVPTFSPVLTLNNTTGQVSVNAPTSGTTLTLNAVNSTTPAINFVTNTGVTTVGAAGAASALPANPVGYIVIAVGGTNYKVPYYNV